MVWKKQISEFFGYLREVSRLNRIDWGSLGCHNHCVACRTAVLRVSEKIVVISIFHVQDTIRRTHGLVKPSERRRVSMVLVATNYLPAVAVLIRTGGAVT